MVRQLTLLYAPPSSCSVMLRMTFAMRKPDELPGDQYRPQVIDFSKHEQLEENYLCRINWKGHVPVLLDSEVAEPIPETRIITQHIGPFLPSLFPAEHTETTNRLLDQLHSLNFWSLTWGLPVNGGEPNKTRGMAIVNGIQARLASPDISPEYRAALERKLKHHQNVKMDAMSDAYTADQHARTGALFASIKQVLDRGDGPWIYGAAYSVIDAQFTVLFHRLRNVGKRALVDDAGLTAYADRLLAVPQWKEVGGAC